jgi:LmbE family N-acetylglucosaminyl deacetylase
MLRRRWQLFGGYFLRPSAWARREPMSAAALSGRVLIVAAHPDDDIIGAGILLSRLEGAQVLFVTDGAARQGHFAEKAGFALWQDYAAARRREGEAALALLGGKRPHAQHFGIADQEATAEMAALTRRLEDLLQGYDAVITHTYEGGHPDHDATALAVHAACRLLERHALQSPVIWEMTGYHFAGKMVRGSFLPHPDAGPVAELVLTPSERDLKRRMFACHASQHKVLKKFSIDVERFRLAPRYDFFAPPHPGTLCYERQGWSLTGDGWRSNAKQVLAKLELSDRI